MTEPRQKLEAKTACFCSSGAFKTYDNLRERENRASHPIINEWGGA
jgi:hypothetical protein